MEENENVTESTEPNIHANPEMMEEISSPETTEGTAEEETSWEPTYTYKVRDEEKEFDEWARPFIKDEDTYKNFQDLYTRGHGLELAKTERDEFKEKYNNIEESLGIVNQLVNKGDTKGFIEALGLPKKMFIDYAINELRFQELPPEEQQRIQAEQNRQLQFQQLQNTNEQLQRQMQDDLRDRTEKELETELNTNYSAAGQQYDARTGVPGSFRQLVIERGIFHHKVNGVTIPVTQAIQEAAQIAGVQAGTQNHSLAVPGTNTEQPNIVKPVLPNLGKGQGTSPTKTVITDIESLKAHRKKKYGF